MKQEYIPGAIFQLITLVDGQSAFIDSEDFTRVAERDWYVSAGGYAVTGHDGVKMHHYVLPQFSTATHEVHHKNEDKLDNRKQNLEVLTFRDHIVLRGAQSNNTSGYKGVYWKAPSGNRKGSWVAQLGRTENGKKTRVHLGRFTTAEAAARAYDVAALAEYGDRSFLNFPNV